MFLSVSRAPLQQLRANLREMETLCGRVRREDARALEKLVQPIREHASKAAHDFLKLHAETANVQPAAPPAPPTNSEEALGGGPTAQATWLSKQEMKTQSGDIAVLVPLPVGLVSGSEEDKGPEPAQVQLQLPEIPQDQNAAESWESLEEDLLELNGLVNEFSELVHSQQEKIDSIEDHVSAAAANVEEGSQSLGKVRGRGQVGRWLLQGVGIDGAQPRKPSAAVAPIDPPPE
ncbi:hypothetical protein Z043_104362 [Scleropages formosus]|uniref:Syntaxin-17 n=1 Tax=Scleropages formosus TaxID=113540 RepID=A0A0P7UP63_SCLFO|nr:hypothetical protein Z043_104362 [Scleropages formosus]